MNSMFPLVQTQAINQVILIKEECVKSIQLERSDLIFEEKLSN